MSNTSLTLSQNTTEVTVTGDDISIEITPAVTEVSVSETIPTVNATGIAVSPYNTITATTLQEALEQLADQKFVQSSTPTLNVENGDFWFDPDDETLYVYREVSTGVFNWVPVMIGNNSPDSDTIDAGSY
jgi:hypothetical protein